MDAFFASVEERDKPYLKGLPVIVGSDPKGGMGRGVVSTANYKARELGIGSALPIRKAWELCENSRKTGGDRCVFITSGSRGYGLASSEVFSIVHKWVPNISRASIDEAYLDLGFCKSFKEAKKLAVELKKEIKNKTKLTCTIGISNSRMVAKIASGYKKPDGLTVILPRNVDKFLRPLPIRSVPGIGEKNEKIFHRLGVKTIDDAQQYSWEELQNAFGKHGFSIWEHVRGIDERKVESSREKRKSIGKHHTFAKDTNDIKKVAKTMGKQIRLILNEVRTQGFKEFRTVVLTVRFDDFTTVTRSLTLPSAISTITQLELKSTKLLLPFFETAGNPANKAIRLIGIRVEKLN